MSRRLYPSIAEEPEDSRKVKGQDKRANSKSLSLAPIDEHIANQTDQKPIPHRVSTKSSGLTVNSEDLLDDSESDRLSAEDDDVFVDGATSKTARDNVVIPSVEILNGLELTENQVREIKEAFLVFDDNGDGCISATELKKLVTSLGYNITEAELMDMMNQIDSDGNGAIDFPEFLQLMSKNLKDTDPEDIMMESFKVFDRDNNGNIGVDELQRVLKLLGQDFRDYEIESMIQGADYDGDGNVSYEDFTRMMNS